MSDHQGNERPDGVPDLIPHYPTEADLDAARVWLPPLRGPLALGEVDLGLPKRDPVLNNTNRMHWFSETFDSGMPQAVRDALDAWNKRRSDRLNALTAQADAMCPYGSEHRWRLYIAWNLDLRVGPGVASYLYRLGERMPNGLYPTEGAPSKYGTGCGLCGVGPDDECSMDCPSRDPEFRV